MIQQNEANLSNQVTHLQAEHARFTEYKDDMVKHIQKIRKEIEYIKKNHSAPAWDYKKISDTLNSIEQSAAILETKMEESPVKEKHISETYYKINLRKVLNFGILEVESESASCSVLFKGILLEILNELALKYIEDGKTNVPADFRGYINRKTLEQKLYGKTIGNNRLNSHITRIRNQLHKNGLKETNFIKSFESFVRLNINKGEVSITDS